MTVPILATRLYIPPLRPNAVPRPRLVAHLNMGLRHDHGTGRRLTLISAAAGYGKTTLLSAWVADCQLPVAWLSLDAGDSDPVRFLAYLIAALQTLAPGVGAGVLTALQAPQPPAQEALLTALLNDVATILHPFLLVLDDYHVLDAPPVDQALTFFLAHMPPQLHLVIATHEDPQLPLARLRACGQLTELRAADLRFTPDEAAAFLNQAMGLGLPADELAALEARTEGWIAGLHLAALALQGRTDTADFVTDFSGSHRFVLDFLVEEVLHQQPAAVQNFLLRTAILNRLCGPLCDAVVKHEGGRMKDEDRGSDFILHPSSLILQELERANLFIVPLDNERRWYRYHHLFGDLLRQRLYQQQPDVVIALHIRASIWYEAHDLELEAFHHAAAANDVARAARLLEGRGMPLLFRGAAQPVLRWLATLPTAVLDAHPALWVTYASALLFVQQVAGVEAKLTAAEAVLPDDDLDATVRDLIGHIAVIRATVAVTHHDAETIMAQAQCALAYLHPQNLPVRTAVTWALGYASLLQGDRVAAAQAYGEALAASEAIGHFIITLMATLGLGKIEEGANRLHRAAEHYRRALTLARDPPLPLACVAHLGLARIQYAWNVLEAAARHAAQSRLLARQIEHTDRLVAVELFLARLKLVQGDLDSAADLLAQIESQIDQPHVALQRPEYLAIHELLCLRQGKLAAVEEAPGETRTQPLIEPLTEREREVLYLIAQGRSNREIAERLALALDTVKGHNRRIFEKLQVQRRTGAVARARELGLL